MSLLLLEHGLSAGVVVGEIGGSCVPIIINTCLIAWKCVLDLNHHSLLCQKGVNSSGLAHLFVASVFLKNHETMSPVCFTTCNAPLVLYLCGVYGAAKGRNGLCVEYFDDVLAFLFVVSFVLSGYCILSAVRPYYCKTKTGSK